MLGAALAETAEGLIVPLIVVGVLLLLLWFRWLAPRPEETERVRPERAEPCDLGEFVHEIKSQRAEVSDAGELERAA